MTENRRTYILGLCAALTLAGCVSAAETDRPVTRADSPPMVWDHRPEAATWTEATLVAVSTKYA